jgi:hypothetical protein
VSFSIVNVLVSLVEAHGDGACLVAEGACDGVGSWAGLDVVRTGAGGVVVAGAGAGLLTYGAPELLGIGVEEL